MFSNLTKSVSAQCNKLLFPRSGGLSVTPAKSESDLVPFMEKALYEWPFPDDLDQAKRQEINYARQRLRDGEVPRVFPSLLGLLVDSRQMDWMIEKCLEHNHPLITDLDCATALVTHQRELKNSKRKSRLRLSVATRLQKCSIPDVDDQVEIDLVMASGANIDELLDFMVVNRMVEVSQVPEIKQRWMSSDHLIGHTDQERNSLDRCLGIRLHEAIGRRIHHEAYNFGFDTNSIWKIAQETVQIRTQFDLSRYPFDQHTISSLFGVPAGADPSELGLYPDPSDPCPLDTRAMVPPRGFHIAWISDKLEPVAQYTGSAWLPSAYLRFSMGIRRLARAFIWRTLIPSLVIVSLGFIATTFAVLTEQYIESVMTQVIPATLIASVALQMTASQTIPPGAGRTGIDVLFVAYYVHIVLLYIVLQFTPSVLSWYLLWIALGVLVVSGGYYLGQAWRLRNPLSAQRN